MTEFTEGSSTRARTTEGMLQVTVVDRISVERVMLMLVRGTIAAKYAGLTDNTSLVSNEIRDLILNPIAE